MKITLFCQKCFREFGYWSTFTMPMVQEAVYEFECPRGHKNAHLLQSFDFEILYESGVNAFVDGYYRDCVASIAASLERMYEFSTRVIVRARGLEDAAFNECWGKVKGSSERQIGVFLAAHLLEFGEVPRIHTSKMAEVRNDVVHKGLIPSQVKATKYAQDALDIMLHNLKILRERHIDVIWKMVGELVGARARILSSDTNPTTTYLLSPVDMSLANEAFGYATFADAVERVRRERRNGWGSGGHDRMVPDSFN